MPALHYKQIWKYFKAVVLAVKHCSSCRMNCRMNAIYVQMYFIRVEIKTDIGQ